MRDLTSKIYQLTSLEKNGQVSNAKILWPQQKIKLKPGEKKRAPRKNNLRPNRSERYPTVGAPINPPTAKAAISCPDFSPETLVTLSMMKGTTGTMTQYTKRSTKRPRPTVKKTKCFDPRMLPI
eukprot:TRINITY_DN8564_c0_g1_i1.p3 TRINITY_DN8564_c0_g1~~TRINITY_DN8564_c0_g1_i1.p3  ORF type:complete len:124 (-),score=16.91 TRINITY_DN8564_c0_g1_i1:85-456(-)